MRSWQEDGDDKLGASDFDASGLSPSTSMMLVFSMWTTTMTLPGIGDGPNMVSESTVSNTDPEDAVHKKS